MEMLLALLIVALMTMSYFMLQQRNTEIDTAQDLGYRLFEYGQALGEYIRTEGQDYPADSPGIVTYDGYAWLQEKGYLSPDFSLVVEPLYVEAIPDSSPAAQIRTEINVQENLNELGRYDLVLNNILVGPVYSRNDSVFDEEGKATVHQDISLIARAVNYANEYRDTLKGSGIIQYSRVESTANEQTLSLIQGHLVDQNMWNDAWLLRSGANTMQGPIKFETSAANDSAIQNITQLAFKENETTMITNLKEMQFVDNGAITFKSNGLIREVESIDFNSAPLFRGIVTTFLTTTYEGEQGHHPIDLKYSTTQFFCAVGLTRFPSNGGSCTVYPYKGTFWLDIERGPDGNGSGIKCAAVCFQYN